MHAPSRTPAAALSLVVIVAVASGCRAPAASETAPDVELRRRIVAAGLTGDPARGLDLPSIDEPLPRLGRKLFFTKALGGDMDSACATCHHALLGGGDGLPVSIGVGAVDPDVVGPGRRHASGVPNVTRNSPTVYNIGLWRRAIFWDARLRVVEAAEEDGAIVSLGIRTPDSLPGVLDPLAGPDLVTAQGRFPIVSPAEMLGYEYAAHRSHRTVREFLAARLGGYGTGRGELERTGWPEEFAAVFGDGRRVEELVSEEHIAAAIGAYERSMVFVDTPWRSYVEGDPSAIGDDAKRGALLFFRGAAEGGAGCAACHAGDFFTDENSYVLAVPQVGPGRHRDPYADVTATTADDPGAWFDTFREEDRYAFRTPTLLNVEVTGPYGHDGAYATLDDMVRHHLDPERGVLTYDAGQLDPSVQTERLEASADRSLARLEEDRRAGRTFLVNVDLTDAQVDDLVAFLHALTDPCVEDPACLRPWVPEPGEPDPDGHRLAARFVDP